MYFFKSSLKIVSAQKAYDRGAGEGIVHSLDFNLFPSHSGSFPFFNSVIIWKGKFNSVCFSFLNFRNFTFSLNKKPVVGIRCLTGNELTVTSSSSNKIFKVSSKLRAGVIWANTYNKFDPTSPFGGYKESGMGREGGLHGLQPYIDFN